jgi:hypothetical protein
MVGAREYADDGEFRLCELGGEAVEGVSSRGRVVVVMDAFWLRSSWPLSLIPDRWCTIGMVGHTLYDAR